MAAMENLRVICEDASNGKFPEGFTLMQVWHLIDIYNDLERGKKHEFIKYEIARLLDSVGIKTEHKGIGWEAIPVAA